MTYQTVEEIIAERDALRAELDALKEQEPAGEVVLFGERLKEISWRKGKLPDIGTKLYARPIPAQSVPTDVVGYLDLGVGGYIDIGSDLSDEELSKLPKGRHALAIVGTWGVDGYVPVPAQSVPDDVMRGRVMEAIAEALGDGAYDCTRVWSAWGYGTMGSDDFLLVANDPYRLHEIAEAAIQAVFATAPKPDETK